MGNRAVIDPVNAMAESLDAYDEDNVGYTSLGVAASIFRQLKMPRQV
jgi:hypothetical protein